MNEFIRQPAWGQQRAWAETGSEKLVFLRKVYGIFTASLVSAAAGACVALYTGPLVLVELPGHRVFAPLLVAHFMNHWFIGMALFFGSFMAASAVRYRPGL